MIYFISDFHFGDEGILTYERTQFTNTQEHDEAILSILEHATSNDTIWFLGDFGIASEEVKFRLLRLKCTMFMIKGNHDRKNAQYYKTNFGFKEIYDHPVWFTKRCVLSHIPVPVEDGVVNIHGHLHGSYLDRPNYINANVHTREYKLYSTKELDALIGSLPKPDYHFLKEWYAGMQVLSPDQRTYRTDIKVDDEWHIIGVCEVDELRQILLAKNPAPEFKNRILNAKTLRELNFISREIWAI